MDVNYKDLVLFTKDEDLKNLLVDIMGEEKVFPYTYDADMSEMDFNNSVTIIDYDDEGFSPGEFLLSVTSNAGPENTVLVLSKNCERKVVIDCARKGASRFIVKPLNKKRFKRFILPYMENNLASEESQLETTS